MKLGMATTKAALTLFVLSGHGVLAQIRGLARNDKMGPIGTTMTRLEWGGSNDEEKTSETTGETGDIGFRFNKVTNVNGIPPLEGTNRRPLGSDNFPLTGKESIWLSKTQAVSVLRYETCTACDIPTLELVEAVGGMPTHPSSDPKDPFWMDFLEVINAQVARVEAKHPTEVMPMPNIWTEVNMDMDGVAAAVHDEFPGVHHVDLLESYLTEGVTLDRDIIPSTDVIDFIRGPVMLSHINTWTMATVGPHNFATKWYVGRARPEEVAFAIQTGEIPEECVPVSVMVAIDTLKGLMGVTEFEDATDFTAYPEGSPKHPSWPAMHSAASAGSLWMPVVMKLTPEQLCQAKAVDYAVAYARTVAGVHYPTDNTAGLNLGQEILARKLPGYLAKVYGANPDVVARKIEEMRFDWNHYLESDCVAGEQQ